MIGKFCTPVLMRINFAKFEVTTAMWLKIQYFWNITLCAFLNICRRFGGSYFSHLQGVEQTQKMAFCEILLGCSNQGS
jgi:hypothetical protein